MSFRNSSITQESTKTDYENENLIGEFGTHVKRSQVQYQFQLDVDIKKSRPEPIFHGLGKSIFEVQWIEQDGLSIVLLEINGATPRKEASYYALLSSHPHLVRTYGLVESDPSSVVLLQERALQGNLAELLRKTEFIPVEKVLWEIFRQVCEGMIYLHKNDIIHGSLACRNVLVFQMNQLNPQKNLIKLTDYGLTKYSKLYKPIDASAMTTMTTVPVRYAAPELLENPKKTDYSEKSDIYLMGVLMWQACSQGAFPYGSLKNDNDVREYKLDDKRLSKPTLCNADLWIIINKCWERKPKNRPNFHVLREFISNLQTTTAQK